MILASASPRRSELLWAAGIDFTVFPADCREATQADGFPSGELPLINAERKCSAVSVRFPGELVLGADTLVLLDGEPLGKPGSMAEAEEMLLRLSGRTHCVKTGLSLRREKDHFHRLWAEESSVTFLPFTRAVVSAYFQLVNPLDKAGAYAIQEHSGMIVKCWSGEIENIIGLPLKRLLLFLHEAGV